MLFLFWFCFCCFIRYFVFLSFLFLLFILFLLLLYNVFCLVFVCCTLSSLFNLWNDLFLVFPFSFNIFAYYFVRMIYVFSYFHIQYFDNLISIMKLLFFACYLYIMLTFFQGFHGFVFGSNFNEYQIQYNIILKLFE